jgi:hypothetical protein
MKTLFLGEKRRLPHVQTALFSETVEYEET